MKRIAVFAVVALLASALVAPAPSKAQDGSKLAYGDNQEFEVTSDARTTTFTFEAKKGDYAIIQVVPTADDGFFGPDLKVADSTGSLVIDSSQVFSFRTGQIGGFEVTEDGEYTIEAGAGEFSNSNGGLVIYLSKAELLEPGKPVEGEVKSFTEDQTEYYTALYLVDSRADLTVEYSYDSRDYPPSMVIMQGFDGGLLFAIGLMGGSGYVKGTMTLEGSREFRIIGVGPFRIGDQGSGSTSSTASFTLNVAEE
jgi:hypothetical protein